MAGYAGQARQARAPRTGKPQHQIHQNHLLDKTRLCRFFAQGHCARGEACTFAHGDAQLMPQPDLFKTGFCYDFVKTGTCRAGAACKFAHVAEELRPVTAFGPHPADAPLPLSAEDVKRQIEAMQQRAMELEAQLAMLRQLAGNGDAAAVPPAAMVMQVPPQAGAPARSSPPLPVPTTKLAGSPSTRRSKPPQAAAAHGPGRMVEEHSTDDEAPYAYAGQPMQQQQQQQLQQLPLQQVHHSPHFARHHSGGSSQGSDEWEDGPWVRSATTPAGTVLVVRNSFLDVAPQSAASPATCHRRSNSAPVAAS